MGHKIAFFGATGGCANSCLTYSLKNGYDCVALARTPAKLNKMLKEQGVSDDIIMKKLTIIKGDIQNINSIIEVLGGNDSSNSVSAIISGIGGAPALQYSFTTPVTLDNPNICTEFTKNLILAMNKLKQTNNFKKPLLAVVSTTGITSGPDDLPFGYHILYKYLLKIAHLDKTRMENILNEAAAENLFSKIIIIRPTLLIGSHLVEKGIGYLKLKVGTENSPVSGYYISRADVGEWTFQSCIKQGSNLPLGVSIFTLSS